MMEIPEGKVSLLDAVPVRCGHITTEWEGEAPYSPTHGEKYEWMRRFYCRRMSPDIHVRLEEHGTAVWNLIDGHRTVREIISTCQALWGGRLYSWSPPVMQLRKDGFIQLTIRN